MTPALAALGWVLLAALGYQYVRLSRASKGVRLIAEQLLKTHEPDRFARYVRDLATHGDKPLIPPTKEP